MASDLEIACSDIAVRLPQVRDLLHEPDEEGQEPGGKPGSSPPWNSRVAAVLTDAGEGIRRLEAGLRYAVAGHPGRRRGGSDGNTCKALEEIPKLAAGLDEYAEAAAARYLERFITAAQQLPAIDEVPVWRTLRPGPDGLPPACRFCGSWQLRVAARSNVVNCFSPDCTGKRPTATMDILRAGPEAGRAVLVWSDGAMDYPPEPPALEATG